MLSHIRQSLPDLKRRVQTMIQEREGLLQALGEPVQKKDMTMHQLIKRFNAAYCELIDGLAVEAISKASLLNENSLTGGSLINRDIFYGSFKTDLGEIVALDGVTLPQTLLILRCTTVSCRYSNCLMMSACTVLYSHINFADQRVFSHTSSFRIRLSSISSRNKL